MGRRLTGNILHIIEEHVHSVAKCYPTLAAGIDVLSGAPWVLGNFVQIVPASTIDAEFDVHRIQVEDLTDDGTYELVLYYGDSDIECGRVRFTRTTNRTDAINTYIQTPIIPANSRIRAKVACSAAAATATISIFYHTY